MTPIATALNRGVQSQYATFSPVLRLWQEAFPMSNAFDPYRRWLGIPPEDQPADHYRLLGLDLFEDDAKTISLAADQRIAYLETFLYADHGDLAEQLLNEVLQARTCLLDPAAKTDYDALLLAKQDLDLGDADDDIDSNIESLQRLYTTLNLQEQRPRECSLPGPPGIPVAPAEVQAIADNGESRSEASEASDGMPLLRPAPSIGKVTALEAARKMAIATRRVQANEVRVLCLLAIGLPLLVLAFLVLGASTRPSAPNAAESSDERPSAIESPVAEHHAAVQAPPTEMRSSSENDAPHGVQTSYVASSPPEVHSSALSTPIADAGDPWFSQLDTAYENGAYADIVSRCTTRLATEPANSRIYTWRGIGQFNVSNYGLATADFTMAIKLEPDYAEAYCWRAITLARLRDLNWAIADCTEAIRIAPKHATAYCIRGAAKFENGDPAGAVVDLNRAIELDPTCGKAYIWRAKAYGHLGRSGEAASDSAKAKVLLPDGKAASRSQGR
jgi:tetratricopeptide (TPR) repeat protein